MASPPPSPTDLPASSTRGPVFRRRAGYRHGRRLGAAALLLTAFALGGVALGTAWWSDSLSSGGLTLTANFYLGTQLTTTCSGQNGFVIPSCGATRSVSEAYTTAGLGNVGSLYASLQYLVAGALVFVLVASILAFLGAFGLNFGRSQLRLTILLALFAFALLLSAPLWAALGQPVALATDRVRGGAQAVGPAGGNHSFWGAAASSRTNETWGADLGWYAAATGAGLALGGLALLVVSRRDPFTSGELGVEPPDEGPHAPGPASSEEPGTDRGAGAVGATEPCPSCGAANSRDAWVCWKCQRPLQ